MAASIAEFWQLLEKSRLVAPDFCRQLAEQFGQLKGVAQQGNANVLAEWLTTQNAITRYQAKVLLSGKSGPFFYGDYVLYDKVSDGPLNGCYRALHIQQRHPVVLCFLEDAAAMSPNEWLAAGSQVWQGAQWVGHPHSQDLYQIFEIGKKRFAVLSDVPGTSLDKVLSQQGRLPIPEACRIAREILLALNTVHQTGAVHGAIRPHNVVLGNTGQTILLQPPISRTFYPIPGTVDLSPYSSDQLMPMMDYMAPELAHAGQVATPASDVYAVGCLLYQMLSGHVPFPGGDIGAKFVRHASEPVQPLEPLGVPPQLAQVVMYAMAKDATVRYPTAAQLAEALAYFVDPRAMQAVPPQSPTLQNYLGWLHHQPRLPAELERQLTGETTNEQSPSIGQGGMNELGNAFGVKSNLDFESKVGEGGKSRTEELVALQQEAKEKQQIKMLIGGAAAIFVLFIGFLVYRATLPETEVVQQDPPKKNVTPTIPTKTVTNPVVETPVTPVDPIPPKTKAPPTPTTNTEPTTVVNGVELVADDGQTLWAAPSTNGNPLKFDEVPSGVQVVMSIRPWDWKNKNRFNPRVLAAAGPLAETAQKRVEQDTGLNFSEISVLQIAWAEINKQLTPIYYVRAKDRNIAEQWMAKLKNLAPETVAGKATFKGPQFQYYWPEADNKMRLIAAYPEHMKELLEAPARLNPRVNYLLKFTDENRLVNLVCNPMYLFKEGPSLLPGQEKLFPTLERALDFDVDALALSLHVDDQNFFTEIRMTPSGSLGTPERAALLYKDKLKAWERNIQEYVTGIMQKQPPAYGIPILMKYAQQVGKYAAFTRVGEDQKTVVVRTYLNAAAAEHLILGGELALAYNGIGAGAMGSGTTPVATNQQPQALGDSVEDKIKKTISFSFDREALDKTMVLFGEEIGVPVEILGTDLQLEGITKNQSINNLNMKDQPANEVLKKILMLANPDGKLVYIIKPKNPGEKDMLFITTRAAVEKRKDKLPADFAPTKAPAKK
jgi:eukaryotic-like serine/threonine-protein kinase